MIVVFYLIISTIAFITYGADKLLAKTAERRVPEKTLFLLGLLGGSFGALPAMIMFRHKIRKQQFWLANISFSLFHLGIVYFATTQH